MIELAVDGAGLVIYPGDDEVGALLYFADRSLYGEALSLIFLAEREQPEDGLPRLDRKINEVLASGKRVNVVSVFDVERSAQPWPGLRALGYDEERLLAFLRHYPMETTSNRLGPFTVRHILPAANGSRDSRDQVVQ